MSNSNLPPGCNSADGGIDHAYETALEKLTDTVPNVRILTILTELAPHIENIYDDAFKEGYDDAKMFPEDDDDGHAG